MPDRPTGYSKQQIVLHWVTVVLVALQFILHDGISDAYDQALETGTYALSAPVIGHAAGGIIILLIAAWRLILRNERGTPAPPEGEPPIFQRLSHWAHLAFYALLVLLPISGAVAWGGQTPAAGEAHEVLKTVLLLLIVGHVGAVIVHQAVWKTSLMTRMTRPQRE